MFRTARGRISPQDLDAVTIVQYRLVSSGLLPDPPSLPDVTKHNQPNDPLLEGIWEESGLPISDHALRIAPKLPKSVNRVKLIHIQMEQLRREAGILETANNSSHDDSENIDIATIKLGHDALSLIRFDDTIRASLFFHPEDRPVTLQSGQVINVSRKVMTWESEALRLRLTADTGADPYLEDILAMDVDIARTLDALFLKFESAKDPFCDRDDIILADDKGLIPVDILNKLLEELEKRTAIEVQTQGNEIEQKENRTSTRTLVYKVTDKLQVATLTEYEELDF